MLIFVLPTKKRLTASF